MAWLKSLFRGRTKNEGGRVEMGFKVEEVDLTNVK
jgi:hypothetical protein